jgi:hypothetical protein
MHASIAVFVDGQRFIERYLAVRIGLRRVARLNPDERIRVISDECGG